MPQNYSRTEVWELPSITPLLGPGSCRRRVKSEGQLLGQVLWCSSWPPLQLGAHRLPPGLPSHLCPQHPTGLTLVQHSLPPAEVSGRPCGLFTSFPFNHLDGGAFCAPQLQGHSLVFAGSTEHQPGSFSSHPAPITNTLASWRLPGVFISSHIILPVAL